MLWMEIAQIKSTLNTLVIGDKIVQTSIKEVHGDDLQCWEDESDVQSPTENEDQQLR